MISCKCGHWYNTSVKCPECDTLASKKWTVKKSRIEYIQEMIDTRVRERRRLELEIRDLKKEGGR